MIDFSDSLFFNSFLVAFSNLTIFIKGTTFAWIAKDAQNSLLMTKIYS